jgi:iron(III) transport system permease protein
VTIVNQEEISVAPQKRSRLSLLLFVAVFSSLAFAAIPMIYLFIRAASGEQTTLANLIFRGKTLDIFLTTIALTAVVLTLATILGVALGWILYNVRLPKSNLLRALSVLPIAIPSYVFTYTWIAVFPAFSGFWAATFVLVLSTTPYVLLAALASLRRVDWSQYEVARTLGLNSWQTFFKVTLPQIRNSIAAGALLVALYTLSDFGAVSLLGVDTFTRAISNIYRGSFDRSSAAVLALILVAISLIIITLENRTRLSIKLPRTANRLNTISEPVSKKSLTIPALILIATYLALGLFIPMGILINRFFSSAASIDLSNLVTTGFSTITVALLGALIALCLGLPLGILLQQDSKVARLSERSLLVVHALPGIVMGLALVSFGSKVSWLYQTLLLLAFSYALLFMAKSVGSIRTGLARVPKNLTEVSSTLGLNRGQTFWRVDFPLAAPSIFSGVLLIFLSAMKELPATLMLRPTGFETLATEMWRYTSISQFSEAAPYALLLVVIAAIPTFLINRPDKNTSVGGEIS